MMGSATPRVVEWPTPWPLLGVTSYYTWINGLVLGPNGTAWVCLGQNSDSRLLELQPGAQLITSFFGFAGAPYDDMHGLAFDGQGGLWYGVASGPNRPAIGMFDRAGVQSYLWELPGACSYPIAIRPEASGRAVWFSCYDWSASGTGGAFFGRLDPAAGTVDYWAPAGLVPANFAIAVEPASNAANVWFSSYGYPAFPPPTSRVVRFDVASGTFYEYTAPTFLRPLGVDLDRRANAWVAEGEHLRFIRRGANCGTAQFRQGSDTVTLKTSTVRAKEERVKPIETPVTASTSTVTPTPENCFENFLVGPATPAHLAIDPRSKIRPRIYFTDPATNTIGRLDP